MILDPAANYSGQFTSLVLASSVWCISERRRQIQDKQAVKSSCLYFRGEFDSDWHSKLSPSNLTQKWIENRKQSVFSYAPEYFWVSDWPVFRDCCMLLHISSFWSNLERNSPNTCQIITALITVEMEIFYKRNSLIKFSTVGCFKVITVLYCWGSWKLQCSTVYWKNKGTGTKENYNYKQSKVCMVSRLFSSYCFTVLPWTMSNEDFILNSLIF